MFDLGRGFLASVERSPEQTALVEDELRFTYVEWFDRIQRAAHGLGELGCRHGDRLLVVMKNRWQMATLHWACQMAGIMITPLNWRSKPDEVDYCVRDAGIRAVVFEGVAATAVNEAPAVAGLPRISIDGAGASMSFDQLCAEAPSEIILRAGPEDYSVMLYTSGTTGRPKGVPRRHRTERAAAVAHVAQNLYRRGECTLGVMPLYHTMGIRSLLAMALVDGCFVCLPQFDAAAAIELIEREKVTNLYLVPTLYHNLITHPEFRIERVRSVEKLGYAGAPMSIGLVQKVDEAFNAGLFVNHYGSSEVYTFSIEQNATRKPGSAGRAALNQRIRVVRIGSESPNDRADVGEEGQIIADMAGDEAFEGYWNRPDADAKALHEGWYFTGDTGYIDEDGDLSVTGRVDDMIITGGENISPVEVEDTLSLHPAVDDVAVAGIADEQWGQRVTAFVCRREPVTEDELDAYCRESSLANFKRPRGYVFVDEIPKSPVGKVLRRKLLAGEYRQETDEHFQNRNKIDD